MDPFLGQIILFAGNFAPRGWALCEGQLLAINSNQALFSLFGTIYGGDGRTTFALPDLRGRAPISSGTGAGLTARSQGSKGGTETNTMTVAQMPSHHHTMNVPINTGVETEAQGYLSNANIYAEEPTPNTNYPAGDSQHNGSGIPFNNLQPYLALNYIVALQGVFPSRN